MKALVNLGLLFIVLFLAGWEFVLVTIVSCIVVLVADISSRNSIGTNPTE